MQFQILILHLEMLNGEMMRMKDGEGGGGPVEIWKGLEEVGRWGRKLLV